MQASPERALRRELVRLRALTPSDFEAVLDLLDQPQRARTLALLEQLEGNEVRHPAPASIDVPFPRGMSPWLIARVNGQGDTGAESSDQFALTPQALRALRTVADRMAEKTTPAAQRHSLLDRLWAYWK